MPRFVPLAVLLLALPAAAADKLPPDLALVPGSAIGLVHVKAADVWKSDVFADARAVFERAGPKALAALDKQFVPAPTSVERFTLVMLPGDKEKPPAFIAVLHFGKAFDAKEVRTANLPKAEEKKANGKVYYADSTSGLAVHFAGEQTLAVSDSAGMATFLEAAGKAEGPLAAAVRQAAGNEQVVVSVMEPAKVPGLGGLWESLAGSQPDLVKAERITLSVTFTKETAVKLSAGFPTAADAKAAEKSLRTLAAAGRKGLESYRQSAEQSVFGADGKADKVRPLSELPGVVGGLGQLGFLNAADDFLADLPLTTDGSTLVMAGKLPGMANQYIGTLAAYGAFLLPAVQKVRGAAARMSSSNNLHQIAIAMHNHHDQIGTMPPAAICDKKGKKLLSWRVAILPYIEEQVLYSKFKLDEPWDSENNKPLIEKMPKIYADPRAEAKPGETYYKVFVGKNAGFDWVKGRTIVSITDGTSNTIMAFAGGDPVTWTKPDDFEFDPTDEKAKRPELVKPFDDLLVAMFDGSVRTVKPTMKDFEKKLRAAITPAGGEVSSLDD